MAILATPYLESYSTELWTRATAPRPLIYNNQQIHAKTYACAPPFLRSKGESAESGFSSSPSTSSSAVWPESLIVGTSRLADWGGNKVRRKPSCQRAKCGIWLTRWRAIDSEVSPVKSHRREGRWGRKVLVQMNSLGAERQQSGTGSAKRALLQLILILKWVMRFFAKSTFLLGPSSVALVQRQPMPHNSGAGTLRTFS